jgi:DNA-binding transcriptional LysR family regulator
MNIRKLNLNLLKALDALLTEKHVSKAANKLFITQPAMSNVLAQLRSLFKDKILVPSFHGMMPTPFALEIAPKIKSILEEIEA